MLKSRDMAQDSKITTPLDIVLESPIAPEHAVSLEASPPDEPTNPEIETSGQANLNEFSDEEPTDTSIVLPKPPQQKTQHTPPASQSTPPARPPEPAPAPRLAPTPSRQSIRMPELGPLNTLIKDPSITEIMVNDLRNVMIEKDDKLAFSGIRIQEIDELNRLIRNILDFTGRILSPDQPYVDVMLPDGSRVNIVAPPLTVAGPCITIRKFPVNRFTLADLATNEMLDRRMAHFLRCCVIGRISILISGGTGSGKTTLLNALATLIPNTERIITIEDTPELVITQVNSVAMQTKPQTPTSPAITARDLFANALRMRPDRIIVGECRRAEAFDMLQAMNSGHAGSLSSIHANSPRDALSRLETLCLMSGVEMPLIALRKQIVSAVDLLIQVKRLRSGSRKIVAITEITGMESETVTLQEIYSIDSAAGDSFKYTCKCTGFVPTFIDNLREQGIDIPRDYFGQA
jgi:pilus assembly protein CpaF